MNKAFTLIEILIVIAILGVLASLVLSPSRMVRDKSYAMKCLSNLRQMQLGSLAYAEENRGQLVPAGLCASVGAYMEYKTDWPANKTFLEYATGGVITNDIADYNKNLACPLLRNRAKTNDEYKNLLRKSYGYNPQDDDCMNASFVGKYIGPKTTDYAVGQRITFIDAMGWLLINSDQMTCNYNGVDDSYRDGQDPGVPTRGVALRHASKANIAFGDGRVGAYGFNSKWGKFQYLFADRNNSIWDKKHGY
jgi:prepilin-type N-terminal cleavage/methylation domain-containing protein/prepilin-type processing-associated H-X9-DG protein